MERQVEDLDRPVRDLVRDGKLRVEFDPAHPPAGLTFQADGDALDITVVPRGGLKALPIMLVIPAVFIYLGFFVDRAPVAFGVIGSLFAAVILAVVVWGWVAREQLRVSRDGVRVRYVTRWGETAGRQVAANAIEMVRVGRERDGSAPAVLIESDEATLTFGAGLKPEAMEWVKQCILRVLAA
ncbi:MAG: hypothetical protein K8T26_12655 [Lentisphaerae bacterium]|nr:hypothetical protein [Lentisphaerota bacterium]